MRFVLAAFATSVVAIFCIANMHVVELYTVFSDDVHASLALLLLGSFVVGFVLATLLSMHRSLKTRQLARTQAEVLPEVLVPQLPAPPQITVIRPPKPKKRSLLRLWR